ncbi:MAG: undecaprenyl-diphosphate phosphatase, partial [Phycisphaeraceae bacterium]|nr:undecaprenyl-diphosphate phosphatase [Phycisphaeraceae bacterium]
MSWWQAILLGLVEGVTEYLPVSSTGHLLLAAWLMGFEGNPDDFAFTIVIQFGAILAVVGLYRRRIGQMARGVIGDDDAGRRLAACLAVAVLPAAGLGPLAESWIQSHLAGPWPVTAALFAGGWVMLVVARSQRERPQGKGRSIEQMDLTSALLIGFGQCLAMWPGTSRSMVTIVTALLLGFSPIAAAEFSFLLGLLTLTGASGWAAYHQGAGMLESFGLVPILLGMAVSAVSAAVAIRWLVSFLNRRGVGPFGWYRIVIATLLAA